MVETWQQIVHDDGSRQLITQVTFYDPIALVKPLSAVYTHDARDKDPRGFTDFPDLPGQSLDPIFDGAE